MSQESQTRARELEQQGEVNSSFGLTGSKLDDLYVGLGARDRRPISTFNGHRGNGVGREYHRGFVGSWWKGMGIVNSFSTRYITNQNSHAVNGGRKTSIPQRKKDTLSSTVR